MQDLFWTQLSSCPMGDKPNRDIKSMKPTSHGTLLRGCPGAVPSWCHCNARRAAHPSLRPLRGNASKHLPRSICVCEGGKKGKNEL